MVLAFYIYLNGSGHANPEIMLKVYSHLMESTVKKENNKIDKISN